MAKITVQNTEITVSKVNGEDYICITDMMKAKDGDFFVTDCFAIGTQWSSLAYGSVYTTPILIMANSPQLGINQV